IYDPSLAPPGGQVLIVQKVLEMDYAGVADWGAHKAAVERFVLDHLERLLPGFAEKVVVRLSASAATSHRYTLNHQGAMLGWEMSPDQLGDNRPGVESPVRNLFFVGHWTRPGGGITPVIMSAVLGAEKVMRQRAVAPAPTAEGVEVPGMAGVGGLGVP